MSMEQRIDGTTDWLSELSEEQLTKILRSELQNKPMDVALIKRVNAVLAAKSKESGSDETEAAWQRFLCDHGNCEPIYDGEIPGDDAGKRGRLHSLWTRPYARAAAAAVIAVAILGGTTLTANALNLHLWDAVVTWVSETFGFVQNDSLKIAEIPAELQELKEMLDTNGINGSLLPTYIPEGYEAVFTDCFIDTDRYMTYISQLSNGNERENIMLQYREYREKKAMDTFQKSDGNPEIYVAGGIKHYITGNNEFYSAVWVNGDVEGLISVPNSGEELTKIIDSIYGE